MEFNNTYSYIFSTYNGLNINAASFVQRTKVVWHWLVNKRSLVQFLLPPNISSRELAFLKMFGLSALSERMEGKNNLSYAAVIA